MSSDQKEILIVKRLPAFMSVQQAAWQLGLTEFEVLILIHMGLLPVLGGLDKNSRNQKKLIGSVVLERLSADEAWLNKARKALFDYWQKKKGSRRSCPPGRDGTSTMPKPGNSSLSAPAREDDSPADQDPHRPRTKRRPAKKSNPNDQIPPN